MGTMEMGHRRFFKATKKSVYVSLHQSPNYPGTGSFTEGNCINFALPGDLAENGILETLDKALGMVDLAKFEVVAVSAGFDTHQGDLATLGLVEQDYFEIGKRVAELKEAAFFVLEGGYMGEKIGLDIDQFLERIYEKKIIKNFREKRVLFLFFAHCFLV